MNEFGDVLQWFGDAFYAIIAFIFVYIYFAVIVPNVTGKVKDWNIGSIINITLVLIVFAILLGTVALFAADWIFGRVLADAPRTQMVREFNRITGPTFNVPVTEPLLTDLSAWRRWTPSRTAAPSEPVNTFAPGSAVIQSSPQLEPNALDLWAQSLTDRYNPVGSPSENRKVVSRREIPQGVMCEVAARSGRFLPKRYEEWDVACSQDRFQTSVGISVNGTAARGLTGGEYYDSSRPFTLFGMGEWPETFRLETEPTAPRLLPTLPPG